MWLNISFILIQSNLTYSSNAIALNLENQPIKTGEYCNRGFAEGQISPYRDEPLADVGDADTSMNEEEADADGLTPAILEARYNVRKNCERRFMVSRIFYYTYRKIVRNTH